MITHIFKKSKRNIWVWNQSDFDSISLFDNAVIRLKRGESFYGSLNITNTNVQIDAFGDGENPVIHGAADISSLMWSEYSAGIWRAALESEPNWIFINGECAKMAQTDWIYHIDRPNASSFTVNTSDITTDIVGAKLIHKWAPWNVKRQYNVTNYNAESGNIFVDGTADQFTYSGGGLQLLNKIDFLTEDNEWCWVSGYLYVKSQTTPASLDIKINLISRGILINDGAHGCVIENIELKHFHTEAIRREDADDVVIKNCKIHDLRGHGIKLVKHPNTANIHDNEVYNCSVGVGEFGTIQSNIYDNYVHHVGMQDNYSWNFADDYLTDENPNISISTGIFLLNMENATNPSGNHIVRNNVVHDCGYIGIRYHGSGTKVYRNHVYNCMLRFSDGAGIFGHGNVYAGTTRTPLLNAEIYENTIHDIEGSFEGWYNDASVPVARGVYCDNKQADAYVHDNVIYDCTDSGIHFNFDTKEGTAENNIIVGCKYSISWQNGITAIFQNYDNISRGNVMVARGLTQYCYATDQDGTYKPFQTEGESDNNYFINPFAASVFLRDMSTPINFANLKAFFGSDANSKSRTNWLTFVDEATASEQVKLYTNFSSETQTVTGLTGYDDIDGNSADNVDFEIPPYYGLILLKRT